ncbi:hypothetical protein ACUV84_018623 [Puccinellia chinampoensis]
MKPEEQDAATVEQIGQSTRTGVRRNATPEESGSGSPDERCAGDAEAPTTKRGGGPNAVTRRSAAADPTTGLGGARRRTQQRDPKERGGGSNDGTRRIAARTQRREPEERGGETLATAAKLSRPHALTRC